MGKDDAHGKEPFTPPLPQPVEGFPDYGHLSLASVGNARDLGGMPAADGRRIRKGRLLRSGDLNGLSALDERMLVDGCDLRRIVDLRTKMEIRGAEDPVLRLPGIDYEYLPVLCEDEVLAADLSDLKANLHVMAEFTLDASDYMRELYVKCVMGDDGQRAYSRLLHGLLESPEGATLWHCTQGKDRTGLAAMLVEHSLGVPAEAIYQDYLATNLFMDGWLQRLQRFLDTLRIAKTVDADLEAYIYADPANLRAALDAVVKGFGSLDGYLEEALDFGPAAQRELRELYLE